MTNEFDNIEVEINFNFGVALELMKQGKRVRVPEWIGYWFKKNGALYVHLEDGSEHMQDDISWINAVIWRDDWEEATESDEYFESLSTQELQDELFSGEI